MRISRLMFVIAVGALVAVFATAAAARVDASQKTTTITFWSAYSSDGAEVKRLEKVVIPYYERTHPGVKVKHVAIPYDQLRQKLVTAVAGGKLPDVVRSDIIWVPELAKLGVLVPLNKAMPDFKFFARQVFPGPLATNYWKGNYYGLPLDTNTRVWIYNAKTLRDLGFSGPPKTFAQLRTMSAAAKAKGLHLYAESGTSGWNILPWIWSGGGALTNSTYTKSSGFLNGAKSVAAVQMLVNLYKAGQMPPIIVDSNAGLGTYDGINQGKYVSTLDGPWSFAIFGAVFKDVPLAGSLIPAGPGGSVSVVGGEDIVLTQSSKNKNAAAEFIRFMVRPWAQNQMARVGQMPVRKDLTKQLVGIHSYYSVYLKQIANARPRTPHPNWPKIDQVLVTEIARAFKGDKTVKQALDNAAKQIDRLLRS